jgi:hypothetical protein
MQARARACARRLLEPRPPPGQSPSRVQLRLQPLALNFSRRRGVLRSASEQRRPTTTHVVAAAAQPSVRGAARTPPLVHAPPPRRAACAAALHVRARRERRLEGRTRVESPCRARCIQPRRKVPASVVSAPLPPSAPGTLEQGPRPSFGRCRRRPRGPGASISALPLSPLSPHRAAGACGGGGACRPPAPQPAPRRRSHAHAALPAGPPALRDFHFAVPCTTRSSSPRGRRPDSSACAGAAPKTRTPFSCRRGPFCRRRRRACSGRAAPSRGLGTHPTPASPAPDAPRDHSTEARAPRRPGRRAAASSIARGGPPVKQLVKKGRCLHT